MRIKLTCCCGATIDIEESFAPTAQQMAGVWLERHAVCHAAPKYAPNHPTWPVEIPGTPAPKYAPNHPTWPVEIPGTPAPPWDVTCTFVDEAAHD